MKAMVQRLRAEIRSDREAVEAHLDELSALDLPEEPDRGALARAAIALHHAYGGVESILLRLSRFLGEDPWEGPDWYQQLLASMSLEIEGVRPAILSPEAREGLRSLLAFRHFFRHAYTTPLDRSKLARLRDEALELREALSGDLDGLDDLLRELAESPEDKA